jgi:hypothetical protein
VALDTFFEEDEEFLQLEKLAITTAEESTTLIKCFFIIWA